MKLLSLLGVAVLSVAPALRADEPPAPPADAPSPPPAGDHAHPGRGMRGDRLKMLAEKLNLTDAQKTQIKAIFSADETQMKALRDDDNLSEEDRRAKFQALRKSTHDQIRALLTPDQQKTFDSMPPPGRGRRGPPKDDGDAPPPPKP